VTSDLNNLSSSTVYTGTEQVHMGNGSGLLINHSRSCCIDTNGKPIYLRNLFHGPTITKNLLSISQLIKDNDVTIQFTHYSCFVKDQVTHQTLLHGTLINGLYQLNHSPLKHEALQVEHHSTTLWHSRLAHCSPAIAPLLSSANKISILNFTVSLCSHCCKVKDTQINFLPLYIICYCSIGSSTY
jgi:hypothetical protein